jgi:putative endonuclease
VKPRSSSSRPKPRNDAEKRAAWWYRRRGYRIVDSNHWIVGYELDLVVRRGRTVVFCEVKSKSGPRFGDPVEMVTAEKIRRIRFAAEAWLDARREYRGFAVRFDVIAVRGRELQCLRGAF